MDLVSKIVCACSLNRLCEEIHSLEDLWQEQLLIRTIISHDRQFIVYSSYQPIYPEMDNGSLHNPHPRESLFILFMTHEDSDTRIFCPRIRITNKQTVSMLYTCNTCKDKVTIHFLLRIPLDCRNVNFRPVLTCLCAKKENTILVPFNVVKFKTIRKYSP